MLNALASTSETGSSRWGRDRPPASCCGSGVGSAPPCAIGTQTPANGPRTALTTRIGSGFDQASIGGISSATPCTTKLALTWGSCGAMGCAWSLSRREATMATPAIEATRVGPAILGIQAVPEGCLASHPASGICSDSSAGSSPGIPAFLSRSDCSRSPTPARSRRSHVSRNTVRPPSALEALVRLGMRRRARCPQGASGSQRRLRLGYSRSADGHPRPSPDRESMIDRPRGNSMKKTTSR